MDLLGNQSSQKLQLADGLNAGKEGRDQSGLYELHQCVVALENLSGETFIVTTDLLVHSHELIDKVLILRLSVSLLELSRHGSTANIDTVVSIEASKLTDHLVVDQLVEAL